MCTILCLMPTVARRGNAIPVRGTGVPVGCELSSEYWESNLGPLPEQPLITESSFQSPPLTIFRQFQNHLFKYILIIWLKQMIIVDFWLLPCVKNTWSGREWNRNRSKFLPLSSIRSRLWTDLTIFRSHGFPWDSLCLWLLCYKKIFYCHLVCF